jgi:predicted DNA-binding transcriptional regulator YafY
MPRSPARPSAGQAGRYGPAERLLSLALILSERRGHGLTLDEMAEAIGVGRRTAERLRDALDRLIGGLLDETDREGRKRWRIASPRLDGLATPRAEELAELRAAVRRLRRRGSAAEADLLDSLGLKLEAILPAAARRRLELDVDALLEASGALARPGPAAVVDPQIKARLRDAILACRQVRLAYRRRGTGEASQPQLHPYGFLAGPRDYLVAFNAHPQGSDFRLYALSNIESVVLLDRSFVRDPAFSLDAFASRSFGVFWDGAPFAVEWRFKPDAAADARRFRFHASQTVTDLEDGSVLVRFSASGLKEMAWHLFTWGDSVEIVAPPELRECYRELLAEAKRAVGP